MPTKIFITIPWFSPAFKAGGPVRSVEHLVCQYSGDVEFFVFCSNKDLDGSVLSGVSFNQWITFNGKTRVFYCNENIQKHFYEQFRIVQPDQLFVIGIFSWLYNIIPIISSKHVNRILSVRGMLHPGALSQKPLKKRIFLSLFKCLGIHRRIIFHATDATEATYISDCFGMNVKVKVAGNFPGMITSKKEKRKEEKSIRLIAVGIVSPMKNYLEVLMALKSVKGKVTFDIMGPVKDPEYWSECLKIINQLPDNIKVNVLGEVPSNQVADHLDIADVFIMPSKSENFGHAHFEALSMGLPLITSHNTPWNHLQIAKAGLNVNADTEAIAEAIAFFQKMDPSEYSLWSRGAREYAISQINIEALNRQYSDLFGTQND